MENNKEKIDNTEPNVYIFGEEIKDDNEKNQFEVCTKKHHHNGGIFGILIIFCGIILLLNNLGLVSPLFWQFVLPFWPVIFILLGVKIILGRNWFSYIITLILSLIIFTSIFIYGLISVNSPTLNYLPQEVSSFIIHY